MNRQWLNCIVLYTGKLVNGQEKIPPYEENISRPEVLEDLDVQEVFDHIIRRNSSM